MHTTTTTMCCAMYVQAAPSKASADEKLTRGRRVRYRYVDIYIYIYIPGSVQTMFFSKRIGTIHI